MAAAGFAVGVVSGAAFLLLAAGAIGGWAYSVGPFPLAWHGLGEVDNALLGGMLLPLFGVAIAGGAIDLTAAAGLVPLALVVGANLLATTWPDRDADAAVGKRTLATRWPTGRLRAAYAIVIVAALGLLVVQAVGPGPLVVAVAGLTVGPLLLVGLASYTRIDRWRRSPRCCGSSVPSCSPGGPPAEGRLNPPEGVIRHFEMHLASTCYWHMDADPFAHPHHHHDSHRGWVRPGGRRGRWIEPFLLVFIGGGEVHGAALIDRLDELLPRAERGRCRDGVSSTPRTGSGGPGHLELGGGPGAPRRVYRLSPEGRQALRDWTGVMRERERLVATFLEQVESVEPDEGAQT